MRNHHHVLSPHFSPLPVPRFRIPAKSLIRPLTSPLPPSLSCLSLSPLSLPSLSLPQVLAHALEATEIFTSAIYWEDPAYHAFPESRRGPQVRRALFRPLLQAPI